MNLKNCDDKESKKKQLAFFNIYNTWQYRASISHKPKGEKRNWKFDMLKEEPHELNHFIPPKQVIYNYQQFWKLENLNNY